MALTCGSFDGYEASRMCFWQEYLVGRVARYNYFRSGTGVSAQPRPYRCGLDALRKRHGMRSPILLWGWPSMIASSVSAM